LGLLPYFSACRFAAVDAGYLKPHPAIFQTALNCLGVSPQEAVFVGDNMDADVVGAQNAGMRGILRRIPVRPLADSNGHRGPDGIVDTLWEMLPLLDLWYPGWRHHSEPTAVEDPSSSRTGQ
jgi:putative hydrolase of the HAD superfamily